MHTYTEAPTNTVPSSATVLCNAAKGFKYHLWELINPARQISAAQVYALHLVGAQRRATQQKAAAAAAGDLRRVRDAEEADGEKQQLPGRRP